MIDNLKGGPTAQQVTVQMYNFLGQNKIAAASCII